MRYVHTKHINAQAILCSIIWYLNRKNHSLFLYGLFPRACQGPLKNNDESSVNPLIFQATDCLEVNHGSTSGNK